MISAGAGRDVVIGGAGDDRVDAGDGNDLVLGDNGELRSHAAGRSCRSCITTRFNDGGTDTLARRRRRGPAHRRLGRRFIDGDAGEDLVFGDQVALLRRTGDITDPRFPTLLGTVLYQRSTGAARC